MVSGFTWSRKEGHMNCDFAVVVTLECELAAIINRMTKPKPLRLSKLLPCYEGTIEGFRIVVAQSVDKGSVCSALAASDLIRKFDPRLIVLLGIAAGYQAEGLELGNVIYADPIVGYEYSKVYDDHQESKARTFKMHPISHQMQQMEALLRESSRNDESPKIAMGKLASGNKVVASENFRDKLKRVIGTEILALEMEAEGVAQAATNFSKPFLIIKGISDYADKETKGSNTTRKKTAEQKAKAKEEDEIKQRRQKDAADASAKVFVQLLRHCKDGTTIYPETEPLSSSPINVLHRIQNFGTKKNLKSTTISKHSKTSPEEDLNSGDETLVLTNSLNTYDSTPPAVKATRENIVRGAKYSYFLPEDQLPELDAQKKHFLKQLKDGLSNEAAKALGRNIKFYSITEECIYNYAIIQKNGGLTGYWYIVASNPSNTADPELILMELEQNQNQDLMRVFDQLKRSSNQRMHLRKSK
jgi:adenosylhomocysteine nucleosidase